MKMKTNRMLGPGLAGLILLGTFPGNTNAAGLVIVEDNFDRLGPLVGSNADSGQTWNGSGPFVTTGTVYQVDGSTTSFASIDGLSFLPSSTYCLSVDMTIFLPISDGWVGLGFKSTGATSVSTGTVGTFQMEQTPEVRSHPLNLTLPQIDPVSAGATSVSHNLEIILQTGATLASSTLTWEVDNVPVRSSVPVDATGIDGIFLAHESSASLFRGQFDRLRLLGPIPEPSSALLLSLAGVGAIVRRRRSVSRNQ